MELEKLKTKYIAREIKYLEETESTQKIAKALAINKTKNGTIVIAKKQTNGIGTHGRTWYTGEGDNIAFTIIIYPNCNIQKLEKITVTIAQCIIKTIKELYNHDLYIKTPNDIMYNKLKIGGILTEASTIKGQVQYLLVGVGLNVNQMEFPEEIEKLATSLKKQFRKEYNKEDIISVFCNNFEKLTTRTNAIVL